MSRASVRSDELVEKDRLHIWHPFTQAGIAPDPVPISTARGAVLYAEDGREYLDLISSWWVNLHGHAHPKIAAAVAAQAANLEQVLFAGFTHAPAVELAERVTSHLPGDLERVFFSDDGSTAVEVALKLAHQYWRNHGQPQRVRYLAFEGAYHGDTVGAMSAGSSMGLFDHWRSLLFEVTTMPYPATWDGDENVDSREAECLAALDVYLCKHGDETAAMIVEPLVQGAAGMRMCRPAFLKKLGQRLADAEVLLIFDEVMTGFGRTGEMFACIKAGLTPDMICLSKGLTGGFLAMSMTVCRERIYQCFLGDTLDKAFAHGHSFTANPLGCAAGIASLDLMEEEATRERIKAIEVLHRERIARLADHPRITRRRVSGTIAAFDVKCEDHGYASSVGPELKTYFMDHGLLIRPLGNVVYLLPPYCIDDNQLHRAYDVIERAIDEVL